MISETIDFVPLWHRLVQSLAPINLQGERCNHAHGPEDLREPKSKAWRKTRDTTRFIERSGFNVSGFFCVVTSASLQETSASLLVTGALLVVTRTLLGTSASLQETNVTHEKTKRLLRQNFDLIERAQCCCQDPWMNMPEVWRWALLVFVFPVVLYRCFGHRCIPTSGGVFFLP